MQIANDRNYRLRQLDSQGHVLSEAEVAAHSCHAALRELRDVTDRAERIEVYNQEGERAGEIAVDYWRLKKGHQR